MGAIGRSMLSGGAWLMLAVVPHVMVWGQDFDIGLTTAQCDTVVSNAASNPAHRDTLRLVRNCEGAFGPTMADLLEETALLATDTTTYFDIVYLAAQFREDEIFDRVRAIATDAGQPAIARAAALAVIYSYITPNGVEPQLEYLRTFAGSGGGCTSAASSSVFTHPGETSLGSNAPEQALNTAAAILSSGAPNVVKFVASCIYSRLYRGNSGAVPIETPSFTPSTDFSYVKQCGRKFLIRNASNAWVSMTLNLAPSSPPGPNIVKQWTAPPRPEGASYSESTWTAPGAGTAWIKQVPALSPHLMAPTAVDTTPC